MHESQMHRFSWFVTLTYSDEYLPENGSLDPRHFRNFIRRLRRKKDALYFGCGEYGDRYQRPHYHTVLFGPDFPDRVSVDHRDGPVVWRSQALADLWGLGHVELSGVTMGSASYVAGYVQKKVAARENEYLYQRVNPLTGEIVSVQEEFARMSLRPAIGRRWIEEFWRDVYPRDAVVVDGVEAKPPRYYDKFMELPDEKGGSEERRRIFAEVRESRWNPDFDDSAYKRNARKAIHEAKMRLKKARDTF